MCLGYYVFHCVYGVGIATSKLTAEGVELGSNYVRVQNCVSQV